MQQPPNVVEAGRVLATLDDWRAITFLLAFLIVFMIIERAWTAASIRQERKDMAEERRTMWKVSENFGSAAAALGERLNTVVTELQVQRALNARLESVVAKAENDLARLERK